MPETLETVAARILELREILEIPREEMARHLDLDAADYADYETARRDIPISMLYRIAQRLGVDFTVLLSGESPRMDDYTIVRRGEGLTVDRYPGYRFWSLAFNYKDRTMEPMIVQIAPEDGDPALVCHGGQEFNLVLEGTVDVVIGARTHRLFAGDSVYFNPAIPHGQRAVGAKATFLTVIQE